MKKVWVKAIPWNKEIALAAVECGADALWVPPGFTPEARKIGIIQIVAEDGDLRPGQDIVEREVREKRDEEEIVALSFSKKVVVKGGDWTIIPLENLLSKADQLFVLVEVDGGRLSGRADNDDTVGALLNVEIDERLEALEIKAPVVLHGRDNRDDGPGDHVASLSHVDASF